MAQKPQTGDGSRLAGGNGSLPVLRSTPELIVVAKSNAGLRILESGISSSTGVDVSALARTLETENAKLWPLFGLREERPRAGAVSLASEIQGEHAPLDLSVYYYVEAAVERLDDIAQRLRALRDLVAGAYVKPPAELPQSAKVWEVVHRADYTSRQGYLGAAPGGIDAHYAWTLLGGGGEGVRIIDCEWGWRITHEDLLQNQGGVVLGTPSTDLDDVNHGTAVIGIIGGDRNGSGVTGISPDAFISCVSFHTLLSAAAIVQAADRLGPGDIILLEIHRPGPNAPTPPLPPPKHQLGFIAIEWWPDDFAAIRYAVDKGIVVVEAAGNGWQDFDAAIYNTPLTGFPTSWTNPFNLANPSSGAVLVGAGAPPPNTHGRNWGPDRSRLDFSNYGQRVDTQGWGKEVTTTGYGDLYQGFTQDSWYADEFEGTSSASPMIVGALACLQGILRARGMTPLDSAQARKLLRDTGSPQQDAPDRPATQRIGNRPNLRQLVAETLGVGGSWSGLQFTGTVIAGVVQDGGGLFLIGGKIHRVPPRNPLIDVQDALLGRNLGQEIRNASVEELISAFRQIIASWS